MGALVSPKSWEDNSQAKLEYLESLVGKLVQERLDQLESEVKTLTSERDNLRGQLSQYNETVKAIKAEAAASIEAAKKSHSDGSSRQRGVWEAKVNDLTFDLNKSEAKVKDLSQEIENIKSENIRLEGELKSKEIKIDLLEEMNSKLDQILEIVKGLAESGATPQQIVEKIDEVKNTSSRIEKVKALIYWEEQGLSSAKDLLPHLEDIGIRHASRISELRKSKEYKMLRGGEDNVET